MNPEPEPVKYPREQALNVALSLEALFAPCCERITIAGSLRRGRPAVGDIELVYVPRFGPQPAGPGDLFPDDRTQANLFEAYLDDLQRVGVLERRRNAKGQETYGRVNKLMRHVPSGIPVDLFATTEACWFNYLVCRTGGADNNLAICLAAQRQGWKWTPYGPGFSHPDGRAHVVRSEREVFEFVGLPYIEPEDRP